LLVVVHAANSLDQTILYGQIVRVMIKPQEFKVSNWVVC